MRNDAAPGGLSEPGWQDALDELERALRDASWAITLLRRALEQGGPPAVRPMRAPQDEEPRPRRKSADPAYDVPAMARPAKVVPPPEPEPEEHEMASAPAGDDAGTPTTFERLWDRIEREHVEKDPAGAAADGESPRGLDLLPQQYLMTIEDRESRVDLVPLHRALLNIAGMDDVSLVTYANGVPVISIRLQGELDLQKLEKAVATSMDRECEVIPQENNKLFLRLRPRTSEEAQ